MRYFFDTAETIPPGVGFRLFGAVHLFWLALTACCALLLCGLYRRGGPKRRSALRWAVAGLLLADELFKHSMLLAVDGWLPGYLPLHLCSIHILLILLYAARPRPWLATYLYAVCLPAAVAALLFPAWACLPPGNFMHLHSATVHILLAVFPLMLLSAGEAKRDPRRIPLCLLLLLALAGVAAVANAALGTNFMFLRAAPPGSPLAWFEAVFGSHLAGFPVLVALIFAALFAPFPALPRRKQPG